MAFEIAKAGWLFRQSTILRRWKKSWVVLYRDGNIRHFESEDSHVAEDSAHMPVSCIGIRTNNMVPDVNPPEGYGKSCLFSVLFRDKTWTFCAESPDDVQAWQFALEQARVLNHVAGTSTAAAGMGDAPPPYHQVPYQGYPTQQVVYAYPGQQIYGSNPPPYVVQQGQPGTTVVYTADPRYRGRYYRSSGADLATGMVAGAAIGTMMTAPLWLW